MGILNTLVELFSPWSMGNPFVFAITAIFLATLSFFYKGLGQLLKKSLNFVENKLKNLYYAPIEWYTTFWWFFISHRIIYRVVFAVAGHPTITRYPLGYKLRWPSGNILTWQDDSLEFNIQKKLITGSIPFLPQIQRLLKITKVPLRIRRRVNKFLPDAELASSSFMLEDGLWYRGIFVTMSMDATNTSMDSARFCLKLDSPASKLNAARTFDKSFKNLRQQCKNLHNKYRRKIKEVRSI